MAKTLQAIMDTLCIDELSSEFLSHRRVTKSLDTQGRALKGSFNVCKLIQIDLSSETVR